MTDESTYNIINEPVPFASDELFFSRTDERGIILSGNQVFQRISMYGWDELLHKPHNLIRHPHMPKAVFWLLWDTIKRGEPIGAYVKNCAKDGRYYWVFAIITPIEGGYLSVRLKPESALLKTVDTEYSALRNRELNETLRPEDSAALLTERLETLGFTDYTEFMATALAQELNAHHASLQQPPNRAIEPFLALMRQAKTLLEEAERIFDAYTESQYVPMNLQVQAAQLGIQGATIGVISNNYTIISDEIKSSMDAFVAAAEQVHHTICNGLFLTCVAEIQQEMCNFFASENDGGAPIDAAEEIASLQQQEHAYEAKALQGLRDISAQSEQFRQSCQDMKRLAAGLEVTRMMAKVESARLSVKVDGLNELIDDLDQFQNAISNGLKKIEQSNQAIAFGITPLLRSTNKAA
ncbi:MAG: chemotaxis protein [Rickettsiales bacterium]|nr:chemotaxis protein [Rickettsiales bacterium]